MAAKGCVISMQRMPACSWGLQESSVHVAKCDQACVSQLEILRLRHISPWGPWSRLQSLPAP